MSLSNRKIWRENVEIDVFFCSLPLPDIKQLVKDANSVSQDLERMIEILDQLKKKVRNLLILYQYLNTLKSLFYWNDQMIIISSAYDMHYIGHLKPNSHLLAEGKEFRSVLLSGGKDLYYPRFSFPSSSPTLLLTLKWMRKWAGRWNSCCQNYRSWWLASRIVLRTRCIIGVTSLLLSSHSSDPHSRESVACSRYSHR